MHELVKFSQWQGNWNAYKDYLEKHKALSHNFLRQGGVLRLRPGFVPEAYNPKSK